MVQLCTESYGCLGEGAVPLKLCAESLDQFYRAMGKEQPRWMSQEQLRNLQLIMLRFL